MLHSALTPREKRGQFLSSPEQFFLDFMYNVKDGGRLLEALPLALHAHGPRIICPQICLCMFVFFSLKEYLHLSMTFAVDVKGAWV